MTILYPAPAPVKSARHFGAGISPTRPGRPFEPSADARAWWAAESAAMEAARLDRHYDELAAVSAYLDRHEAGLCC